MAGSVSTTAAPAVEPVEMVNHKIVNNLYMSIKMTEELRAMLNAATEAFNAQSYKTAAKYFKSALDSMSLKDGTANNRTLVLTKYMLCKCWLESTDANDLFDALKNLEELERNYGYTYPMLYYAIGKAYFKLYRFNKADEILKKGFAVLNRDNKLISDVIYLPETNFVISESAKDRLVAALVSLNDQCSSWHRPDAVCCKSDCSTIGHNESADRNIFYGSPTFIGMVQVTCNNPLNFCIMSFHVACWKAKKELLCSMGKMSDKDVLHLECFTPNCENEGVRCTIKKIEVFDENAEVKSTIEPRADESVWHPKPTPPPKGAIRKQQQQHQQQQLKVKTVPNESRAALERNARASSIPNETRKVDETEDDDDLHDEQALKLGIEKLSELRTNNFGIKDDLIWRPNLSMYGNEYMLATAEVLPDPEFSDDNPEDQERKAFIFSWFYTLISNDGPIKLDSLDEKWNEANSMIENCETILKHHSDITEFLLQSLKFSIVGDYICVAEKLPAAYDLVKANACEVLKFFMENDMDQHSTGSSIDDEVVFNDFINKEKNNNSLSYCSIFEDKGKFEKAPNVVEDMSIDPMKKDDNRCADACDAKSVAPSQQYTQQVLKEEPKKLAVIEKKTEAAACAPEISATASAPVCNIVTEKKPVIRNELPKSATVCNPVMEKNPVIRNELPKSANGESSLPTRKVVQKRSHSPELSENATPTRSAEKSVCKVQKECVEQVNVFKRDGSPRHTINGAYSVHEIENQLRDQFLNKTKSTNDPESNVTPVDNIREISINNSGESDWRLVSANAIVPSVPLNTENGDKNPEIHSDVDAVRSKWENDKSLVVELTAQVDKLNQELTTSKAEVETLKLKLVDTEKVHAAMRGRMLQKILHRQYVHNQNVIAMKLKEWRKNYELMSGIQQILGTSIGETLPVNGLEWWKIIIQLEKMAKNHEEKFLKLNDELCASVEMKELREVELQQEEMPNFPKVEFIDIIQSALGLYRMHQMKEFQKLQLMPCSPPQPPAPPTFGAPLYGHTAAEYHHSNRSDNNPRMFYPGSQSAFMHAMPTQQNFNMPLQQVGVPLLSIPAGIPRQGFYDRFHGQASKSGQNTNHVPAYRNIQPFLQQNLFPSVQQSTSASHSIITSIAGIQPNFLSPMTDQTTSSTMRENCSTIDDQSNGQSTEQSIIIPAQKRSLTSDLEQQSSINIGQEHQQQVDDVSTKYHDCRSTNAEASVKSGMGELAEKNVTPDLIFRSSDPITDVHRVTSHNQIDTYDKAPQNDDDTTINEHANTLQRKTKSHKMAGHSMDKLMRRLRTQYIGVLELDLLKSVECVRKKHNNSLSKLTIRRIIRETDKFIGGRQQKQLCGYEKRQPEQFFAVPNSTSWCLTDGEPKRQNSESSTSSVTSWSKEQQLSSKKQWEPVTIPNDTWIKETQESECVICLSAMTMNKSYTLQCKHTFHKTCIKDWYNLNRSCPTCRMHSIIDDEFPPLPCG